MMSNKPIFENLLGQESIRRFVLENGITLLVYPNHHTSSVNLVGLLNCGSAYDPKEKQGLAHFTAAMLTRGTKNRDFSSYHQILEENGASLSFSCGARNSWFHGKSLSEDIEMLIDLAADSLIQPGFQNTYINRLRKQLVASLAIRDQDASDMSSLLFDRLLFPDHPYGKPVDGSIESVSEITEKDIENFHMNYYSPSGMIIAIAGAVNAEHVHELAQKYFANWPGKKPPLSSFPAFPPPPMRLIRKHFPLEEKSQADLVMGTFGPKRAHPDFLPAFLGNNILGQFGLFGRIGKSVRSRSGLAYYASSSLNGWSDGGTWEISAGTNPENLEKTISLIQNEIKVFLASGVSREELSDSRSHLIGRLPLSLESNAGLTNAILTMERFNLGLDYYQKYAGLLQSITADQILVTARKYLHPEHLVIASAGAGGSDSGK